jgi:hypothetical protein
LSIFLLQKIFLTALNEIAKKITNGLGQEKNVLLDEQFGYWSN